jgi:hypothetical protein
MRNKDVEFKLHECAQHSVHPTSGSLRVFKQFSWLGVGSVKMALSPPAQPPVTLTVGLFLSNHKRIGMKPSEYLLLQLELEGRMRVSSDLITRLSPDVDDFPLALVAHTSDGESLLYFDELIPEEIRCKLPKDLPVFKTETAIGVFERFGIQATTSHFKTYVFPESFESANMKAVRCFSQDDPKIVAFGFDGLANKVFAIEKEGMILSACVSSRQNSKCAEAWVFTHPDYRRKGLAQQVVTVWAREMQKEGRVPFYSHSIENTNSALLAKRLKLTEVFEETVLHKVS